MEGGAVGHIFERDPPGDHPCQVCLIWFSGFTGEDLNVIFYQNMPNLHNRINRLKEKFHRKTRNLCYTTPYHVVQLKFELILIYNKAAMDN